MSDSDLFAQTQRAEHEPCLRCQTKGLVCEYVSTEKQKARVQEGKLESPRAPDIPRAALSHQACPISCPTPAVGDRYPFYGGYDNNTSSLWTEDAIFSRGTAPPSEATRTPPSATHRAGPLLSASAHMHRCRPTRLTLSMVLEHHIQVLQAPCIQ
ncbi:hypothetical protein B0H14DRAFT_3446683 [Mycena olivaceomarginata]|nr:hypothetical protein B0H14DRAFT_3446683 [Mycena olivaceomarginata]